jgi:micrococcal nuclease
MYIYKATVVKIVDGDTLDVDIDLGFYMVTRQRLRVNRIDTPERGQPGFHEATNRVKELCPVGGKVKIATKKTGKFGRWIAEVMVDVDGKEINLSDQLLLEDLAKLYGK